MPPTTMGRLSSKIRTQEDEEEGRTFKQYNAQDILKYLVPLKRSDAHTLCAFTMQDLYRGTMLHGKQTTFE